MIEELTFKFEDNQVRMSSKPEQIDNGELLQFFLASINACFIRECNDHDNKEFKHTK